MSKIVGSSLLITDDSKLIIKVDTYASKGTVAMLQEVERSGISWAVWNNIKNRLCHNYVATIANPY